jgi:hypothetical protein
MKSDVAILWEGTLQQLPGQNNYGSPGVADVRASAATANSENTVGEPSPVLRARETGFATNTRALKSV